MELSEEKIIDISEESDCYTKDEDIVEATLALHIKGNYGEKLWRYSMTLEGSKDKMVEALPNF